MLLTKQQLKQLTYIKNKAKTQVFKHTQSEQGMVEALRSLFVNLSFCRFLAELVK